MEVKDGVKTFSGTRSEWRKWLEMNHQSENSVWLIMYKIESQIPSLTHDEAVDEALCFGWIDSIRRGKDEKSFYQYFTKRKPKSNWSRINKDKIKRLTKAGLMAEAGIEMVRIAQANGTWTALDDVENLIVPNDLQKLFDQNPKAFKHWNGFPRSSKRLILEWILNAKRPETRQNRIKETVALAEDNIRANHFRQ